MIRPVAANGRIETGGAFTPIQRPRIVERIATAAGQRIVLILAPAGYGKSVALRQYLASIDDAYVRYDVHPEHASLLGFVRGFADALLELAPDARKTVSGAYEKSSSSNTPGADLAMWLHAHIKTFTGVVAIDDLHIAENDPEISKFLVSLIERTKGRVKWILASRSSLDLPVGSWLAYGEMDLNIDEQDLRFTMEEARQTAKASRVGVRDEELAEILSMTEGWPTALSFALRTSTRSVDLRNIAASTREMVYRYLAEQVYKSLDDDERELLFLISYLPVIDVEVLRGAGYVRSKAVIEQLRDRVAFIYPDRPGIYRCHDLFRDFLRHELDLEGDGAVREVQLRAAHALERAHQMYAALWLFAQAKSEEDVLRVLETHGFTLMEQAHADAVHSALDSLSQEIRASSGLVLGLRGLREWESGRFDRAESLLERAVARAGDDVLAADLAIRLALVRFNLGRPTVDLLEPLIELALPESIHASALAMLAAGYAQAKRGDEALRMIHLAEDIATHIESDELRAKIYLRVGIAAFTLQMSHDRVSALFTRAQALAHETALYSIAAHAWSGLANVTLFYDDDVAKYAWYAQQALNAAIKAGDRLPMQTALLQLINAEVRRGNSERLQTLQAQFAATATTDAARMSYALPARAMSAAWEGRFDEAHRLMSMADRGFFSFDRVFNASMLALYAIVAGQRDRAIDLAAETMIEIETGEFPFLYGSRAAEIARMLCACVEALAGRLTSANRILQRRRPLDGELISAMREAALAIWRAVKRPALRDEALDAFEQLRCAGWGGLSRVLERATAICLEAEPANADSPLTKTELGVLQSLAEGRSPKDIAEEAGRSVYTVQAHIQNIIKKLGCSGRQEALAAARKRGLLS